METIEELLKENDQEHLLEYMKNASPNQKKVMEKLHLHILQKKMMIKLE